MEGLGLATEQDWSDLAFALPLAMLAYTGLETVANLAEETREPGRALPRSLFSAIGLVVIVTVLIAAIGLSAYPAQGGETALGDEWLEAPLVGIVAAFEGSLPSVLVDALRFAVGVSGAMILARRGDDLRLGHHPPDLLARRARLAASRVRSPRATGARFERGDLDRSRRSRSRLIVVTEIGADGDPTFLASIYSFGVLIAFTAAQLAVIRLRRARTRSRCARFGLVRTSRSEASRFRSPRSSALR